MVALRGERSSNFAGPSRNYARPAATDLDVRGGHMRQFLGLTLFGGLAIIVAACGGGATPSPSASAPASVPPASAPASAPASQAAESAAPSFAALKVGLVTDVGQLEDKSFNEASMGRRAGGRRRDRRHRQRHRDEAPADYATNIQRFVDQGYGTIVTVGFAIGDAHTRPPRQPEHQVHRRRPGRLHRCDRQERPDLRLQGRSGDPPAELPGPRLQRGPGRLPRRRARRKRHQVGRHRRRRRDHTIPAVVRYMRGYGTAPGRIKPGRQGGLQTRPGHHQGLQRPGHGQVDRPADVGQKADVIFQVAGLSGAGAIEAACAAPGVIGIGVDVDQSKSLPQSAKCIITSAEKKLVDTVTAAILGW